MKFGIFTMVPTSVLVHPIRHMVSSIDDFTNYLLGYLITQASC
jgi:hypothetical protein